MPNQEFALYADDLFSSPYTMSAFVSLKEKGVAFDLHKLKLGSHNLQPAYRQLSLSGRVPTLVHGGFHLSESSAISEYLEELLPPPSHTALYPADRQQRARARQVQAWLRSDFMPIRTERSTMVVFYEPVDTPLSEAAQNSAETLFHAADSLLADDADCLFGNWCIADTDLALMLNRLLLNGDAVPGKLARYARLQWQRPSVQEWLALDRSAYR
ncbi:MAG: glutathione transferase [Pseudomonadota bacterium]